MVQTTNDSNKITKGGTNMKGNTTTNTTKIEGGTEMNKTTLRSELKKVYGISLSSEYFKGLTVEDMVKMIEEAKNGQALPKYTLGKKVILTEIEVHNMGTDEIVTVVASTEMLNAIARNTFKDGVIKSINLDNSKLKIALNNADTLPTREYFKLITELEGLLIKAENLEVKDKTVPESIDERIQEIEEELTAIEKSTNIYVNYDLSLNRMYKNNSMLPVIDVDDLSVTTMKMSDIMNSEITTIYPTAGFAAIERGWDYTSTTEIANDIRSIRYKQSIKKSRRQVIACQVDPKTNAIRKDKKRGYFVGVADENRTLRFAATTRRMVQDGLSYRVVDMLLTDFIDVRVENNPKVMYAIKNNKLILQEGIECHAYVEIAGNMLEITTNKMASKDMIYNEDGTLKEGYRKFAYFNSTPSSQKSSQFTLMDVTDEDRRLKAMMEPTAGFIGRIFGEEMTLTDAIKQGGRTSISWSGSINIGEFKTYAVLKGRYDDRFTDEEKRKAYKDSHDGLSMIENEAYARILEGLLKRQFSNRSIKMLKKMFIQCKPTTAKTATKVVSKSFIELVCEGRDIVRATDIDTYKDVKDGTIIIYGEWNGDINSIEFLADTNAQKTEIDPEAKLEFEISEVTQDNNKKSINTSIQMLQKILLSRDPKVRKIAEKYISILSERTLMKDINILNGLDRSKLASIDTNEDKAVYSLDHAHKIYHEIYKTDKMLSMSYISRFMKSAQTLLKKLKFKIDGVNRYILACPATMFGYDSILDIDEMFIPGVREERVSVLRYPCPEAVGCINVTALSLKEINERIDDRIDNERVANEVKKFYSNISTSEAIISAHVNIKKILGGADHDFDSIFGITDEIFVELMESNPIVVINIDSSKEVGATIGADTTTGRSRRSKSTNSRANNNDTAPFDFERSMEGMIFSTGNHIKSQNSASIGSVTKQIEHIYAMQFSPEKAVELFQEEFGTAGIGRYESAIMAGKEDVIISSGKEAFAVTVDKDLIKATIENAKACDLKDMDNINDIIYDLGFIFRYYQELTIDGYKKAIFPEILFELGKKCKSYLELEPIFKVNKDTGFYSFEFNKDFNDDTVILDDFVDLKTQITQNLVDEINTVIKSVDESEMEENLYGSVLNYNSYGTFKTFVDSVIAPMGRAADERIKEIRSLAESDICPDATRFKKEIVQALDNTLRHSILRDSNETQIDVTSKRYRLFRSAMVNEKGFASFNLATSLLNNEHLTSLAGFEGANDVIAYSFHGKASVGSFIKFNEGKNKHGYTEEKIDGFYQIVEHAGSLYAIKPLQVEFTKRAVNEMDDNNLFVVKFESMSSANTEADIEELNQKTSDLKDILSTGHGTIRMFENNDKVSGAVYIDGEEVGRILPDPNNFLHNPEDTAKKREFSVKNILTNSYVGKRDNKYVVEVTMVIERGNLVENKNNNVDNNEEVAFELPTEA